MTHSTNLIFKYLEAYENNFITLATLQNKASLVKRRIDELEDIIEDYYSDEDDIAEAEAAQEIALQELIAYTLLTGLLRKVKANPTKREFLISEFKKSLQQ